MKRGYFKKSCLTNCAKNANFENGGTTTQIGILHVLLNMFSMSLLSRLQDTSGYFEMQQGKFNEFISPDEGLFERNM